MKRFIKDNRGQVLYAVVVTVMFLGVLSMIAMGLTLQNYHAAVQKQAHVTDYYAADAVAELIRSGVCTSDNQQDIEAEWGAKITVNDADGVSEYTVTRGTVTLTVTVKDGNFTSWEVDYHAAEQTE